MRGLFLAILLCGCGGETPTQMDMGGGFKVDMTFHSNCGQPGDPGNALGVGKFCNNLPDCSSNTKATLCATLGSADEHFCTFMCTPASDGGTGTDCGEGASCACSAGGCGCHPNACN